MNRTFNRFLLLSLLCIAPVCACNDLVEEDPCGDADYDEQCEERVDAPETVPTPAPTVIPGRP